MSEPAVNEVPGLHGPDRQGWQRLLPLFREINDLKRIRAPGVQPSLAGAYFRAAAMRLFHSQEAAACSEWQEIAASFTREAIVGTRLAAISIDDLRAGGLSDSAALKVFERALRERRPLLDAELFEMLLGVAAGATGPNVEGAGNGKSVEALSRRVSALANDAEGSWIDRLVAQPRAGATAPGMPRIVLEPVESCAEHCFVTAVYAVLLAPSFGAAVEDVFAIGIAHHLHNARLPDAGFAGEELIGDQLGGLISTLRSSVLAQMAPAAAARTTPLLADIDTVDSPLARTFHTADTIDRVLQIEYFDRCNRFTLETAMVDMELVHAGPIQAFQNAQLEMAGLGSP